MKNKHPYPSTCPFCKVGTLKGQPRLKGSRWATTYQIANYTCGSHLFDDDDRSGLDVCTVTKKLYNGRPDSVIRFSVY